MTVKITDINNVCETIKPGSYVLSKCGRDRGRLFVVTDIEDADFVYIADGKLRKVQKPKKKKLKHVLPAGGEYTGGETLTNKKIVSALNEFRAAREGCITNIEKE